MRTDGNGLRTLLIDALGNVLELADGSGTLQTHFTYDSFGTTALSGAPNSNAVRYVGRENDGIGLYYYRARYYSVHSQRFIAEDPLGPVFGPNPYAYVLNQPTTYTDPLGLWPSLSDFFTWSNHVAFTAIEGLIEGTPVGDAASAAHTVQEGREILNKEQEIEKQRQERDEEVKRAICETEPNWALCKDLPPKDPKKKSKSDDPDYSGGNP